MLESSVKVTVTRQEIHLYVVYAVKRLIKNSENKLVCSCGTQYIRKDKSDMHKETCKSNENQSGTITEDMECLGSDNHAMGTTYEAFVISMVLDN